jgi:hypothetical protein
MYGAIAGCAKDVVQQYFFRQCNLMNNLYIQSHLTIFR